VAVKCDFDKILCDALFAAFIVAGFYPLEGFVVFAAGGGVAVGGPDIVGEISHYDRQEKTIEAGGLPISGGVLEIFRCDWAKEQGVRFGHLALGSATANEGDAD